jgi:hypothetical protein
MRTFIESIWEFDNSDESIDVVGKAQPAVKKNSKKYWYWYG